MMLGGRAPQTPHGASSCRPSWVALAGDQRVEGVQIRGCLFEPAGYVGEVAAGCVWVFTVGVSFHRGGVLGVTGAAGAQSIRYPLRMLFPRSRTSEKAEPASPGRHRTDVQGQEEELPDEELESYLAALSPDGDPETTGSGRRFGGAEVYQLRLSLMANEQLRRIAAHRQTSPMALAQEWVMQRLEWECQQLHHR
jgi:hypothetical protein